MGIFGWSYPPGCNGTPDDEYDDRDQYYDAAMELLADRYSCRDAPRSEWEKRISHGVYKYTDCGAWIRFDEDGITVGSIVEGSDAGAESASVGYQGFSLEWFDRELERIEKECYLIWAWANEVREDGKTDAQSGLDWPLL